MNYILHNEFDSFICSTNIGWDTLASTLYLTLILRVHLLLVLTLLQGWRVLFRFYTGFTIKLHYVMIMAHTIVILINMMLLM